MSTPFNVDPAAFPILQSLGMPKPFIARRWLQGKPEAWFRDSPVDDRDRALLDAQDAPWVHYAKTSYLRKITDWTVENDDACKKMVAEAGGQLVGFDLDISNPAQWKSMKVNVNITAKNASFDWGFLSTVPSKVRIFRGPVYSCQYHPWDAMILRDCYANTGGMMEVDSISSRYWDILVMKMCEDYDYPWVVAAVKDAGPYKPENHRVCFCC
ncbi:hypothetical protein DL766_003203 [Monosporascus sp. MC13-8B]|uniref:Uncharacterized protein n=1 Tax=Monosporascus cannonballus TaxID=155416 RepID=A0ABY0HEG3_9PEZI|nr:hypothetical protein DL762_002056 [Monosporascus cannonballus]RYO92177.1 hypothetical protein DL763_004792 [Monosporascus cannonballus]RYP34017.1 hypothetical protein DL766_003203 [Monosporascus sp. MC13-8B]